MKLGLIQIPLTLDKASKISLQRQIVIQITKLIESGVLPPGAQLPSLREFSREYGVSRNTVILAYQYLANEGWIEVRQGALASISKHPPSHKPKSLSACACLEEHRARDIPILARVFELPRLVSPVVRHPVDFRLGETAAELFPRDSWQHWTSILIRHSAASISAYLDPHGLPELRAAIVEHVGITRGIATDSRDVVVVQGIQEALSLIASLLIDDQCSVLLESPGYRGAHNVFQVFGARIDYLPVDDWGGNPSGIKSGYRLLHVTPSHQFPMGVTLATDRRLTLVEWANRSNAYIIENDYDADFRYVDSPLAAMASIDRERVIYLGTFSKHFGPGLRLGYMICPPSLTPFVARVKALLNGGCSWLDQAVVSRLMQNGEFGAHLRSIRRYYKKRRDQMVSVLSKYGGRVRGEGGGMHVCWELPECAPDAQFVESKLRSFGVKVYLAEEAAVCGVPQSNLTRLLFLGFGAATDEQIFQLDKALAQTLGSV